MPITIKKSDEDTWDLKSSQRDTEKEKKYYFHLSIDANLKTKNSSAIYGKYNEGYITKIKKCSLKDIKNKYIEHKEYKYDNPYLKYDDVDFLNLDENSPYWKDNNTYGEYKTYPKFLIVSDTFSLPNEHSMKLKFNNEEIMPQDKYGKFLKEHKHVTDNDLFYYNILPYIDFTFSPNPSHSPEPNPSPSPNPPENVPEPNPSPSPNPPENVPEPNPSPSPNPPENVPEPNPSPSPNPPENVPEPNPSPSPNPPENVPEPNPSPSPNPPENVPEPNPSPSPNPPENVPEPNPSPSPNPPENVPEPNPSPSPDITSTDANTSTEPNPSPSPNITTMDTNPSPSPDITSPSPNFSQTNLLPAQIPLQNNNTRQEIFETKCKNSQDEYNRFNNNFKTCAPENKCIETTKGVINQKITQFQPKGTSSISAHIMYF